MAFDTALRSYLGGGIHADRPAAPNIPTDMIGFYLSTDSAILSMWDPGAASWAEWDISGIINAFTDLSDVPAAYTGEGTKLVAVKADESGLEFVTAVTQENVEDFIAAALTEGIGITITYDDGAGTITLATTITQYTDEMARDAIGTALTAGTGISITPDDGADTITIACTVTEYTDEMARDALGTALTAGAGITITPNDGADTIEVASSITQYTDSLAQAAVRRTINNQAASYTLVLADALAYVRLNNAGAVNLTVPANASVAFEVGTEIPIFQKGAGQVTVVADVGVTINYPATASLNLREQYSTGLLTKVDTNEWDLTGDLELA